MGFNASLLSHDEDKITECMNNFVSNPNNESYIYDLLELNDTYHDTRYFYIFLFFYIYINIEINIFARIVVAKEMQRRFLLG